MPLTDRLTARQRAESLFSDTHWRREENIKIITAAIEAAEREAALRVITLAQETRKHMLKCCCVYCEELAAIAAEIRKAPQ